MIEATRTLVIEDIVQDLLHYRVDIVLEEILHVIDQGRGLWNVIDRVQERNQEIDQWKEIIRDIDRDHRHHHQL